MKYLFVAAHPDDLEAAVSEFLRRAVQKKHEIKIACMTRGEYGTMIPSLKGEKIAKIRTREYTEVLKLYGLSKKNLTFLGLIDGSVKYKKAKEKLKPFINNYKPDIIIAPEYQFGVYYHMDHIETGKAVLSIVKAMSEKERPKYYVYQSFINDIFIPADIKFSLKALNAHQSQFQVIGFLYPLLLFLNLVNGFHYRRLMNCHALRRINFKKKLKLSFMKRLIYHAFKKGELIFKAWDHEE